MIVRDEEATLARCLESARGAVDEMCIVDTGSTDRTLEIARSFGAKVRSIEWPDSFAEARNVSLDMATGDWVLVLDADEVLLPEAAAALRELTLAQDLIGVFARLIGESDGQPCEDWVMRFFKSAAEHRFEGAIHNQLCGAFQAKAEEQGLLFELSGDFVIERIPRAGDDGQARLERSLKLYERALKEEPDNLYVRYKYGEFLRGQGQIELAIEVLDTVCDRILERDQDWRAAYTWCTEAFALCVLELMNDGQLESAGERLEQATYCPATANLCFVYGLWCLKTEQWTEALQAFQDCRTITGPERIQAPAPGVITWKSAIGMCEAAVGMGQPEVALEWIRAEAEELPHCVELWVRAIQLETEVHGHARAAELLPKALEHHATDPALLGVATELLLQLGAHERALETARDLVARVSGDARSEAQTLLERCEAACSAA